MMDNSRDIEKGRLLVLRLCSIVVFISAFVILQYNFSIGTHRLPSQLVRFGLTVWLCVAIYKGSQPARWIAIFLMGIGGVLFLALMFSDEEIAPMARVAAAVAGTIYLLFAGMLWGSSKVIAFLNHQRSLGNDEIR